MKQNKVVPVDVRITDVSKLPPKYFMHENVIEALRLAVRSDVVAHEKPVPPGAQGVFSAANGMLARNVRLAMAKEGLGRWIRKRGPTLFVIVYGLIALVMMMVVMFGGES